MSKFKYNEIKPKILGQSQKGQDSFIDYTFKELGTTNKYYVEFGAGNGIADSNTFYLRESLGWNGLLLDSKYEDKKINLHKVKLTKSNIRNIFNELNVPKTFDFLSVDIDGNDFWLLNEILIEYKPRVILVETNVRFSPETDLVQKYDDNWFWTGKGWYGASPRAMFKMTTKYKYVPVYIHLDDMFLIQKEEINIKNYEAPSWNDVYPKSNIDLYNSHGNNVFDPDMWITPNFDK